MFALVDCNSFYVSCERVFNPKLNNFPVGVLSNNDGCVVALSQELKDLDVHRGIPAFKIKHLEKNKKIKLFSSNYTLYADMSRRVMETLEQFTPDLEIYSIDEAFLSLKGFEHLDLEKYGAEIKKTVEKWTGIPVSVGIGKTKTLSKIANSIAKKRKNSNVFMIDKKNKTEVLKNFPVEKIWGIGRQYAKLLHKYNIKTALNLTKVPDEWIFKNLTIVGTKLVNELKGFPSHELEIQEKNKKGIVSSKSFGKPVKSLKELEEAVASYMTIATKKLRNQNSVAKQISVFLRTNPFSNKPHYANYKVGYLNTYSAFTPEFIKIAINLLKKIYLKDLLYKKVGVMISDIIQEDEIENDLFEKRYQDTQKKKIMSVLDDLNDKLGTDKIKFASSGTNDNNWQMKREKLSQKYTTNWNDLIVVK